MQTPGGSLRRALSRQMSMGLEVLMPGTGPSGT